MYMKCGWVLGLWGIFFFLTFCTFPYFLNFVPFSLEKLYAIEKYCICFSPLQWSPPGSNSVRHPAHPLPWLPFSLSTDVCVLCTAAFLVLSIWQSLWLVLGYIYVRSLSLIRLHFHQSIFPVIVHSELEALCPKCQLTEVTVTNSGRKTNV